MLVKMRSFLFLSMSAHLRKSSVGDVFNGSGTIKEELCIPIFHRYALLILISLDDFVDVAFFLLVLTIRMSGNKHCVVRREIVAYLQFEMNKQYRRKQTDDTMIIKHYHKHKQKHKHSNESELAHLGNKNRKIGQGHIWSRKLLRQTPLAHSARMVVLNEVCTQVWQDILSLKTTS